MTRIFDEELYPYMRSPDQDATPAKRHDVVIIGAGPVGLAAGIDLAMRGVPVVILDDNTRVSSGSRAICFSQHSLEILDRLGCAGPMVEKGVVWDKGKVFFDDRQIYDFDLLPEAGHKYPAFINLQQYHLERFLVARLRELQGEGKPIELRGGHKLSAVGAHDDHVKLNIETCEGPYELHADWVIACDGANSATRRMLGLEFDGRVFEDNFLIADTVMDADFPTERWFWFDPPFNKGQSALLHKQPDNVWRIDFQIGWDIDREEELKEENVRNRLQAMLGRDARFQIEWTSIYTFQCRRMNSFRHGRVLFAGDAAHQVSPFGARGANSGLQDAANLCWKLQAVIHELAPDSLLDSYSRERVEAADENILNSTRSTEFITPKSETSRNFRDAVLDLAEHHAFARPLVNSGRLSTPTVYQPSASLGPDSAGLPHDTRPGAAVTDAPVAGGWLMDRFSARFCALAIGCGAALIASLSKEVVDVIAFDATESEALSKRYLGTAHAAVYLIRPDGHIAARWIEPSAQDMKKALARALETQAEDTP